MMMGSQGGPTVVRTFSLPAVCETLPRPKVGISVRLASFRLLSGRSKSESSPYDIAQEPQA